MALLSEAMATAKAAKATHGRGLLAATQPCAMATQPCATATRTGTCRKPQHLRQPGPVPALRRAQPSQSSMAAPTGRDWDGHRHPRHWHLCSHRRDQWQSWMVAAPCPTEGWGQQERVPAASSLRRGLKLSLQPLL